MRLCWKAFLNCINRVSNSCTVDGVPWRVKEPPTWLFRAFTITIVIRILILPSSTIILITIGKFGFFSKVSIFVIENCHLQTNYHRFRWPRNARNQAFICRVFYHLLHLLFVILLLYCNTAYHLLAVCQETGRIRSVGGLPTGTNDRRQRTRPSFGLSLDGQDQKVIFSKTLRTLFVCRL